MKSYTFLIILFVGLLTSCSLAQNNSSWYIAPDLNDGFETTNPASVNIREDSLNNLLDWIQAADQRDFRALMVIKNGKLVVEEYFNSFWRTNIHDIRSAGKSVTSMLAGIAMDKGLFKPTDPVFSFFPKHQNQSKEKSKITINDLLIMSSGLASDDYDNNSPGLEGLMSMEDDFLKFVLDLPMDFQSGERFAYSSAVAFLLGAIIEKRSGMRLEDFARQHLFGPLGITEFFWQKSPKGINTGMGNLYFQGRDLAKLGLVMLQKGKWKNQQIISADYVKKSFHVEFDISKEDPFAYGYGYMWYIAKEEIKGRSVEFYYASGNGGNKIFIIPSLDMVVTTFSSAYGQGYGQRRSHNILRKVLNAVELD